MRKKHHTMRRIRRRNEEVSGPKLNVVTTSESLLQWGTRRTVREVIWYGGRVVWERVKDIDFTDWIGSFLG